MRSDTSRTNEELSKAASESVLMALDRRSYSRRAHAVNGSAGADLSSSSAVGQDADEISRIIDLPPPVDTVPTPTLHALQEWEGCVVEIGDKEFVASLIDLTAGSVVAEEEVTIPLADISDRDADSIELGSIFRWVIGYERSPSGTKKRVSYIVFRDLPVVTKTDVQLGQAWAEEVIKAFGQ